MPRPARNWESRARLSKRFPAQVGLLYAYIGVRNRGETRAVTQVWKRDGKTVQKTELNHFFHIVAPGRIPQCPPEHGFRVFQAV